MAWWRRCTHAETAWALVPSTVHDFDVVESCTTCHIELRIWRAIQPNKHDA